VGRVVAAKATVLNDYNNKICIVRLSLTASIPAAAHKLKSYEGE